jgi:anti-sigma factor RsiW
MRCEEIHDKLVDYVDGELPADQLPEVTDHLDGCAECQKLLGALNRSLQVAQTQWAQALKGAAVIQPASVQPLRRWLWPRVTVAAAAIVMAAGGIFLAIHRPGPTPVPMTVEQIERGAERAASAARLLAATELLAQCRDTQALVEAQYRYILTEYADTPVATNLRRRGL